MGQPRSTPTWRWLTTQPSLSRTMRLTGLICLGAGAGLIGADLRYVRGHDVIIRSGGLVVNVFGKRPRVVPVLKRYHDLLQASAAFAEEGLCDRRRDPAAPQRDNSARVGA